MFTLVEGLLPVEDDFGCAERRVLAFLNGRTKALTPLLTAALTETAFCESEEDERDERLLDFNDIWSDPGAMNEH